MSLLPVELPTIQNWNCHSCNGCCRQHEVEVTPAERQRILDQNWTPEDGVRPDVPLLQKKGPPWKRRWVLGSVPEDGACVFLDEKGLCRIHAKFGEPAKPLACQVYPYAFHPAGRKIVVSLRFSCPSVVKNLGRRVSDQRDELLTLVRQAVPEGVEHIQPPEISRGSRVEEWPDFLRFTAHLDDEFTASDVPVVTRLQRALTWLKLVEQSKFDALEGERIDEFLELIRAAAAAEVDGEDGEMEPPSRTGRMLFRMLVAQYARSGSEAGSGMGLRHRWRMFRAATKFARGRGDVPPLQGVFQSVPFETVEQPFGVPEEAEETFTRYFRVKIRGLQFCGRAFFGVSLVEGFRALAMMYPAILWLARWLAAGDGRSQLTLDDVQRAVAIADHFHAYAPATGNSAARRRLRLMEQRDDLRRLCAWYSR